MKSQLYRQGDVLMRQVSKFPAGSRKPVSDGILAHGEVTGHAHRVQELSANELFMVGDGMFLKVGEEGVSIVHEEHDSIQLPPGNYEIVRQREYSPEEIRNVAD